MLFTLCIVVRLPTCPEFIVFFFVPFFTVKPPCVELRSFVSDLYKVCIKVITLLDAWLYLVALTMLRLGLVGFLRV